jgi:hypothetical protein
MMMDISDEVVAVAIAAYDDIYEAELRIGSPTYTDNKESAIRAALLAAAPALVRAERERENEACAEIVEGEVREGRAPCRAWPQVPGCNFVVQHTNAAAKFAVKAAVAIRSRITKDTAP